MHFKLQCEMQFLRYYHILGLLSVRSFYYLLSSFSTVKVLYFPAFIKKTEAFQFENKLLRTGNGND